MTNATTRPWTPVVGHIKHPPRSGVPYFYIGRTMPNQRGPMGEPLFDRGAGNPLRLGKNSADPVADFILLLSGDTVVMARVHWDGVSLAAARALVPRLVGRDLL